MSDLNCASSPQTTRATGLHHIPVNMNSFQILEDKVLNTNLLNLYITEATNKNTSKNNYESIVVC